MKQFFTGSCYSSAFKAVFSKNPTHSTEGLTVYSQSSAGAVSTALLISKKYHEFCFFR